ncbi:hypothetical protein GCM10009855_33880 [Gordonia cholesterolivorans]|uniref:Uncharacterized protein n=1 Tax=Gordonia cholesterolivorans TaxID=559625 RepID=A0ABN3I025_9ACTN
MVAGELDDSAAGHLAQAYVVETEAVDEAVQRGGEHRLVRLAQVGAVGTSEGDPVTAQDIDVLEFAR